MRFAFDDDQLAFASALADLLAKECSPAAIRAAWDGDGRAPGVWEHLTEMGVIGLLAPEGVGGLGMTEVDLVLLCAEAGRAGLPDPLTDVAMVAVPALRDHAQTLDAETYLERICHGERVAVGLGWDPTVAHPDGVAAYLLEADDGLHLVDPDVVEVEPVESVDGARRLGIVRWTPSPATRVADPALAASTARDRAALGAAAELCGLSRTMIDVTVAYVAERKQFGVPVGSFQAVKHHLANALLGVSFAEPLVWRAAVSVANGDPDASLHVSMAKASASDAAQRVTQIALQCHGAIGYTVECDLHLYMKRAWSLIRRSGDAAHHRRRVGAVVLG